MIYPQNFQEKTNFEVLARKLNTLCLSDMGRAQVDELDFITDYDSLCEELDLAADFLSVMESNSTFPSQDYFDLRPALMRLKVPGSIVSLDDLVSLKLSLTAIARILIFIYGLDPEQHPMITPLIDDIYLPPELMAELGRLLDDHGQISDHASPTLAELRRLIRSKKNEAERRILKYLNLAKKEAWTPAEAEVSIRNERLVIPMAAAHKRQMNGMIHDVSATGQTIFVEPEEIYEINNAVRELENEQRLEIVRILKAFSDSLREHIPDLCMAYDFLGFVDFQRAKALLAIAYQGARPILKPEPLIHWFLARNPVLEIALKKQNKSIVPLEIHLEPDQRILIISGPNAGGKSVCLKTVGLIQYMMQCGLLVPLSPHSEMGCFDTLFMDIGDQQSLENDLSTYSSHLSNMKVLLQEAQPRCLFLVDEFGAGTEPRMGGAMAEAILEQLYPTGAFGVVTTHYGNLKVLADRLPAVCNGAMLFDTESLKPLYRLKTGNPGSSFAFEMAMNIGMPPEILEQAAQKIDVSQVNFERQVQQLETEKLEVEKLHTELRLTDDLLSETLAKYQRLQDDLESQKRQIIQQAHQEAKAIIKDAQGLIEQTIRGIREAEAEKEATKHLRHQLQSADHKLQKNIEKLQKSKDIGHEKVDPLRPLKVGDAVRIDQGQTVAQIVEIKAKEALLANGPIQMRVRLDRLSLCSQSLLKKSKSKPNYGSLLENIHQRKLNFSPSIDLRGMSADEAFENVQKLIDDAVLYSEKSLRILHGRGDGVLRRVVKEALQYHKSVETLCFEAAERGGDGITLVTLK